MPEFPTGTFDDAMDNLMIVFQSFWDFLVDTRELWVFYLLGIWAFIMLFRLFFALLPKKKS